MKTTLKLLITICAVSLFTQKIKAQHQISLQTSAINYYFDYTPLNKMKADGYSPFSLGLQYQYQKPSHTLISAQINVLFDANKWNIESDNFQCVNYRRIKESNVIVSKQKQIYKNVNWTYGIGPTLRIDFFAIDTVPLPYDYQLTNIYQSNQLQLGVKGQTALTYTPLKWLTLYSQFNFSGYLVSRAIQMNYNNDFVSDFDISQRPNFPSRLHSSLTFGVGINF